MTPEEKARREIDRQLEKCGWIVQDREEINISAGLGVGIREFSLQGGEADHLLYADAKAIGTVEGGEADSLFWIAVTQLGPRLRPLRSAWLGLHGLHHRVEGRAGAVQGPAAKDGGCRA